MSADVEPIGPPWRDGGHCPHCHPQCDGRYDPHDGGIYHEVGEAFTWHPEYGCPVCRNVALLRRRADRAAKFADQNRQFADAVRFGGAIAPVDQVMQALTEAKVQDRIAAALRDAADHIEVGEA